MKKLLLLSAILFCSHLAFSQAWAGVLDPSRSIDWQFAGVTGGIPTTRTQCGSQISAYTGSPATINNQLSTCAQNTYVLLGPGTFSLSGCILVQPPMKNVTLRGSGPNSTFIVPTNTTCSFGIDSTSLYSVVAASTDNNDVNNPSNIANWIGTNGVVGTYTRFATSLLFSSKTNLVVGSPVVLDQIDDQSDPGISALYIGCERSDGSSACYTGTGPGGYTRGNSLATQRGQQQIVIVTGISGSSAPFTVTVSSPGIYADNWNGGATGLLNKKPQAWWSTNPVYGIGFENFALNVASQANWGTMALFNCVGCWVKDLKFTGSLDNGFSGWSAIKVQLSPHNEIRDSYFWGNSFATNSDDPVVNCATSTDLLVENNIMQNPGSTSYNVADCEGFVSAYNFGVNRSYGGGTQNSWMAQSSYIHAPIMFHLIEGNISNGVNSDSTHGTHVLNAQFRNRFDGYEQNNGNPVSSSTIPLRFTAGTRFENVVGNILGSAVGGSPVTSPYHTKYVVIPGNTANTYFSVIDAGWYQEAGVNDPLTYPTSMFWANWDVKSNATRFCGNSSDTGWSSTCGSASEVPTTLGSYSNPVPTLGDTVAGQGALPKSFFLSAQPAWWPAGKPWPPIGPDVTGGNLGQCAGGTFNSQEAFSAAQCTGGSFSVVAGGKAYSNPAMDCYFTVMGGNANGTGAALAFDPTACPGFNSTTPTVTAPTFSPIAGTYTATQTVTITTVTGGATICYTTDNSTPTANGGGTCTHGTTLVNGGTVSIAVNTNLKAIGTLSGDSDSSLASATYVFVSVASLSPSSLTFGSTTVGSPSIPQTVTLSNTGAATLNITSVTVTGDYSRTTTCGSTLPQSNSCTISVTFTPTTSGTRTGTLSVIDDASNGSPQTTSLSGTGSSSVGNILKLNSIMTSGTKLQ